MVGTILIDLNHETRYRNIEFRRGYRNIEFRREGNTHVDIDVGPEIGYNGEEENR
jgi:hypothetical protein